MAVQFDSASVLGKGVAAPKAAAATSETATPGFGDALHAILASVDNTAGEANTAVTGMMDGTGDVHDAMLALQRAQTTLELTIQVRNKLVGAYQEIMRMPV
jgi:flagellar hook-basal body complex protein FliE